MKAGVQFLVVLGLALLVPPAIASDFFNILSNPSHDDIELVRPTLAEHAEEVEHNDPLKSGLKLPYNPFDYFRLATQWAPTHCRGRQPPCALTPLPQFFTIHGLWPDNLSGPFLAECVPLPYDPITDRSLYASLAKVWLNVEDGPAFNENFWEKEWKRHGTCSLLLYDQTNYFIKALSLYSEYDVIGAIRKSIPPNPSDTYQRSVFISTIKALTTKEPGLGCITFQGGIQALHEVHICFTPQGVVMDCPADRIPIPSRCTDTIIFFPLV